MRKLFRLSACAVSALCLTNFHAHSQDVSYVEPARPYSSSAFLDGLEKKKVDLTGGKVTVPLITWAADGITVLANGGLAPDAKSDLAKAVGLPVELEVIDQFDEQVRRYLAGETPFLRGTVGMISLAAEALKAAGPDYEPIVIMQLSWSTGADGFVAKDIKDLSDLKGKSIVVQAAGPHVDLVQVLLEDAGLKASDVDVRFVSDITYNPAAGDRITDPASAFREDASLSGAACIFPDILTLTAGGTIGTGAEDSVKGARSILSTRTASRVIADIYAVRADFLKEQRPVVHGLVKALLAQQAKVQSELANIADKSNRDASRVQAFQKQCSPLAEIFLADAGAVNDYIAWLGVDLELTGQTANISFLSDADNPIGLQATSKRIQNFYVQTGFRESVSQLQSADFNFATDFGPDAEPALTKAPAKVFTSSQSVRKAAESEDASLLFSSEFVFPPNTSEIKWNDHRDIFDTLHEKVSRYGGAVVQLRGHADNFFYNFVQAKRRNKETTYKKRIRGTNDFQELPLPQVEQVIGSANQLSFERAFAVKRAYAQYLREALGYTNDEIDLSRFDVKGMGVSAPLVAKPKTPEDRAKNMRGEMFIYAVEAEIPVDFGIDDLQ